MGGTACLSFPFNREAALGSPAVPQDRARDAARAGNPAQAAEEQTFPGTAALEALKVLGYPGLSPFWEGRGKIYIMQFILCWFFFFF